MRISDYIQSIYSLEAPLGIISRVTLGYLNQNYILGNGKNKYFLKQYRFNSVEPIKTDHQVSLYFAKGGIPVVLPLKNNQGMTYFKYKNRYYAIFPFVNGQHFNSHSNIKKQVVSMAKMLASVHLLGSVPTGIRLSNGYEEWNGNKSLNQIHQILIKIESKKKKSKFDELALKSLNLKLSIIKATSIRMNQLYLGKKHLIHGDYREENIFFNPIGEVCYIFDFEKTGMSPRVAELIRSIDYTLFNGDFSKKKMSLAALYIKTYQEIYPLKKEELQDGLIAYFLKMAHALWIEKEHYLHNNTRVDDLLIKQYGTLKYLSVNLEKLVSYFTEVLDSIDMF